MATVKLKNEGEKIVMIGRETITSENLTFEKYQTLVDQYPSLADKFEVIEEKPSKKGGKEPQTTNAE